MVILGLRLEKEVVLQLIATIMEKKNREKELHINLDYTGRPFQTKWWVTKFHSKKKKNEITAML